MQEIIDTVTDPTELAVIHNARPFRLDESAFMFRLRALYASMEDDERGILDFKRLKLRDFWVHAETPITRMSQAEIVDTAFGFEWLLLSEIYVQDRPPEWFEEFEEALELVRSRVFDLIKNETSKLVLNSEGHAELLITEEEERKRKRESEFDYDSDEEKRVGRRVKIDAEFTDEFATPPYRVNDMFVMDMDSVFKAIDSALCTEWMYTDCTEFARPDIRALRNAVFREFQEVKEATALDFRRKFIQDLLVTPSYVQTHARWKPFDKRPTSRSVLVRKNDALAYISIPKSIGDIITPPSRREGVNAAVDMRINTDAALFYVSGGTPNNDRVSEVWKGTLGWASTPEMGIGRLLASQRWVVFLPDGTKKWCTSFSAAFLVLGDHDEKTREFIQKRLDVSIECRDAVLKIKME